MRVLVACEFSGIVRDAFLAQGHEAMSCDYSDTKSPGPHYKGDVLDILGDGWDLLIAHPPCTYLASSGARHMYKRTKQTEDALWFVRKLMYAPIPQVAIENPVGVISTRIRKPDQIIQPWQFGHPTTKATCLWLRKLPKLQPTNIVTPYSNFAHDMFPHYNILLNSFVNNFGLSVDPRGSERSQTFCGIAYAMATQWTKEQ